MFSVNDKVVLVDNKWPDSVKGLYAQLPVKDSIYVVRATRVGVEVDPLLMDLRRKLVQSILLVGITNPANKLGVEYGFNSERFRKLDEVDELEVLRREAVVV